MFGKIIKTLGIALLLVSCGSEYQTTIRVADPSDKSPTVFIPNAEKEYDQAPSTASKLKWKESIKNDYGRVDINGVEAYKSNRIVVYFFREKEYDRDKEFVISDELITLLNKYTILYDIPVGDDVTNEQTYVDVFLSPCIDTKLNQIIGKDIDEIEKLAIKAREECSHLPALAFQLPAVQRYFSYSSVHRASSPVLLFYNNGNEHFSDIARFTISSFVLANAHLKSSFEYRDILKEIGVRK